jgi:tRNA1(Val) A37 N6-methylase TrmN6
MAQRVLDAGAGTGVAALALCARIGDACVTGIEIQPALLEFARENARINGMEDRVKLVEADITADREALEKTGLRRESFDHVAANPPFFVSGASREAADPATARAYSAGPDALEKWVRFLATAAAPGGTLTLIHRAEALGQLLALLEGKFGGLSVYPLYPRDGVAAKRILVRGIKGSRAPLRLLPGMVLHKPDGSYTAQADAVLRDAAAIDFGIK